MSGIVQKIKKEYKTDFDFAKVYYAILFELNSLKVSTNELNLVCYSSIYGTLSTPPVRDEFMKLYKVPKGSFYNMVSKLQRMKILTKVQGKVRINPAIQLDFSKPIYKLDLTLVNKHEKEQL